MPNFPYWPGPDFPDPRYLPPPYDPGDIIVGQVPIITFINLRISGSWLLIHLIIDKHKVFTRAEVTSIAPTWVRWFRWLRGRECLAGYAWRFRNAQTYNELPISLEHEEFYNIPLWPAGQYRWLRFRFETYYGAWSVFSPTWAVLIPT